MNEANFKELLVKYQQGQCTAAEKAQLESWVTFGRFDGPVLSDEMLNERLLKLEARLPLANAVKIKLWPRIVGVAAAVAAITFGIWFFSAPRHPELVSGSQNYANDIGPGGNRAVLTAGGKTINLSEAKTGIAVNDDIKYNDGTTIDPSALGINLPSSRANAKDLTLEVAALRGGIYSIILQDGTKAWLNAASKLKFESNYRNKLQRIVKLEGEAYFEVAKDAKRPFIVESNGQRTEVLGTHFNISAYPGEAIKTTLLEGSVSVSSLRGGTTKQSQVLKPNQQSILTANNEIKVTQVDASQAIAWKEGQFSFQNEALESIMQKVARWYDVEVVYKDENLRKAVIWGKVSRFENISQVLSKLQLTGQAKFKLEGRTVFVQK